MLKTNSESLQNSRPAITEKQLNTVDHVNRNSRTQAVSPFSKILKSPMNINVSQPNQVLIHQNKMNPGEIGEKQILALGAMNIINTYPLKSLLTNCKRLQPIPVQIISVSVQPSVEGREKATFPVEDNVNNTLPVIQQFNAISKADNVYTSVIQQKSEQFNAIFKADTDNVNTSVIQQKSDQFTTTSKAETDGLGPESYLHFRKPHSLTHTLNEYQTCCTCSISHCVKRYCTCFSNGRFCNMCKCNNCFNNINHEEQRQKHIQSQLRRDKNAFLPKIVRDTLKSGQYHTRGCRCKRSYCQKKYCECFEGNIFCSAHCQCVNCSNRSRETYVQQSYIQNPVHSPLPTKSRYITVSGEIAEAVGLCMLSQALQAESEGIGAASVEERILDEFRTAVIQIIETNQKWRDTYQPSNL